MRERRRICILMDVNQDESVRRDGDEMRGTHRAGHETRTEERRDRLRESRRIFTWQPRWISIPLGIGLGDGAGAAPLWYL